MKLAFVETDYGVDVWLDDECIWSDCLNVDCPEDLIWDRKIECVFEAGRKLGFEEGKRAYQYPRDALDL